MIHSGTDDDGSTRQRTNQFDSHGLAGSSTLELGGRVVYRLGPFGYYVLTTATHGSHVTTDQIRTSMGAGTLSRNGDPNNHGLHFCDTQLTADAMTMTPNVTKSDTPN